MKRGEMDFNRSKSLVSPVTEKGGGSNGQRSYVYPCEFWGQATIARFFDVRFSAVLVDILKLIIDDTSLADSVSLEARRDVLRSPAERSVQESDVEEVNEVLTLRR